jgi:hypothetical protein
LTASKFLIFYQLSIVAVAVGFFPLLKEMNDLSEKLQSCFFKNVIELHCNVPHFMGFTIFFNPNHDFRIKFSIIMFGPGH